MAGKTHLVKTAEKSAPAEAKKVSAKKAAEVEQELAAPAKKAATKTAAKKTTAKAAVPAEKAEKVVKAPAKAAKKATKPKKSAKKTEDDDDVDLSDIEEEVVETVEDAAPAPGEKVKPLRMKLSKAKEKALMKEFGLDDAVLSEEDLQNRRQRLKTLIKLGKTRGYLTHAEISDHLPDKLVDAETLEAVITTLSDLGVAVRANA